MNINDYQQKIIEYSATFEVYGTDKALPTYTLGLAGETGEVCELIKRHFRGDEQPNFTQDLTKELGDVIAYISLLAHVFDIDLDEVLQVNLRKLDKRRIDKKQLGKGNDR